MRRRKGGRGVERAMRDSDGRDRCYEWQCTDGDQ
jgi:hypothetical protein